MIKLKGIELMAKKEEMEFSEALKSIVKGNKITRSSWNNPEVYLFINPLDQTLCLHQGKMIHQVILCEADITATDWTVTYGN